MFVLIFPVSLKHNLTATPYSLHGALINYQSSQDTTLENKSYAYSIYVTAHGGKTEGKNKTQRLI